MAWARIDDLMPDHPKLAKLGVLRPLAGWLHVCAICYAARYLTDGFIPAAQVDALTRFDHVGYETGGVPGMFSIGEDVSPAALVEALVHCGMWHKARGGYLIHDYLEYNPSRAVTLAKRYSNAERVKKFRALHQEVAPRNALRNALPDASPTPTTKSKAVPDARARAKSKPRAGRVTRGPDRSAVASEPTGGAGTPPGDTEALRVSPQLAARNGHGPLAGTVASVLAGIRPLGFVPPAPAPVERAP